MKHNPRPEIVEYVIHKTYRQEEKTNKYPSVVYNYVLNDSIEFASGCTGSSRHVNFLTVVVKMAEIILDNQIIQSFSRQSG